jgi:hypothetical protein
MALGGAADLVADLVGHAVAGSAMEFGTQGRPQFSSNATRPSSNPLRRSPTSSSQSGKRPVLSIAKKVSFMVGRPAVGAELIWKWYEGGGCTRVAQLALNVIWQRRRNRSIPESEVDFRRGHRESGAHDPKPSFDVCHGDLQRGTRLSSVMRSPAPG